MPDKTKRKNDARHPRRRLIGLIGLLAVMGLSALIWMATLRPSDPTGQLYYGYAVDPTADTFIHLDLNTGESEDSYLPLPHATTVGAVDPYPAPQHPWTVVWEDRTGFAQDFLVVRESGTGTSLRELGQFYSPSRNSFWGIDVEMSPDGQWVVFGAYNESSSWGDTDRPPQDLWLIQVDTGERRRLTESESNDHTPTFTPDGSAVIYLSDADGLDKLYRMDLATGSSGLLAPDLPPETQHFFYTWSPDRQWISVLVTVPETVEDPFEQARRAMSQLPSEGHLYLIPASGRAPRLLVSEKVFNYRWSYDSQWIAFGSYDAAQPSEPQNHIYRPYYAPSSFSIIRVNGTDRRTINAGMFPVRYLSWIP